MQELEPADHRFHKIQEAMKASRHLCCHKTHNTPAPQITFYIVVSVSFIAALPFLTNLLQEMIVFLQAVPGQYSLLTQPFCSRHKARN